MPRINVDLRFVEINYELWALGKYHDLLEEQLPVLSKKERLETTKRLKEEALEDDWSEVSIALQEYHEIVDMVLPRYFRSTILITQWSLFESAVTYVARTIKVQRGETQEIREQTGDFLRKADKYFKSVLQVSLCDNQLWWQSLRRLLILKTGLTHGHGRIELLNSNLQEKIKKLISRNIGVSVERGVLMFSEQFVRQTCSEVGGVLRDLVERV